APASASTASSAARLPWTSESTPINASPPPEEYTGRAERPPAAHSGGERRFVLDPGGLLDEAKRLVDPQDRPIVHVVPGLDPAVAALARVPDGPQLERQRDAFAAVRAPDAGQVLVEHLRLGLVPAQ